MQISKTFLCAKGLALAISCLSVMGCVTSTFQQQVAEISQTDIPRELEKVSIPAYRVEQPDILLIEAVNNIRPSDDRLRAGDRLLIRVSNTLLPDPEASPLENEFKFINNIYDVQSNGSVDLGPEYGSVVVSGLTVDEAREAIDHHLRQVVGLAMPKVALSLPDVAGKQQITGEHLITPDGTISLGIYGSVYVAGMTLDEVKRSVEAHLAPQIHNPEVRVSVLGYNSKVFYVVTDGGGFGEQVVRLPFTGNETVLDAIAQIQGLSDVSSRKIWVARPATSTMPCSQTMVVDWRGITQQGMTGTNYQLFPGDRIYIKADKLISMDNFIGKVTAPVERIMGVILLSNGLVGRLDGSQTGGGGVGGGGFF